MVRFFKDSNNKKGGGSLYAILEGERVKYWFKDTGWQVWLYLGDKAEKYATCHHQQEVGALEVLVMCGNWNK